jgi:chorismate mutase
MSTAPNTLEEARDRIDDIDHSIVELLAERYAVVDDLCEMKAENGDTVKDEDREQELLDHVASIAEAHGLSPALTRRLYEKILAHSVRRQRRQRQDEEREPDSSPAGDSLPKTGTVSTSDAAS